MKGCHSQMGDVWCPGRPLTMREALLCQDTMLEEDWRKNWKEGLAHPNEPHIPLGMAGRFKRQVGEKVYIQPLVLESDSGLQYRLWMYHALQEHGKANTLQGPMFRVPNKKAVVDGEPGFKRAKIGDLDNVFRPLLLRRVQEKYPETI
jgi:hypothetical protein